MIQYLAGVFARDIDSVRKELEAYPDDGAVWKPVPGMSNTAGTLALHLAGNLQHFVGSRLGGTGYIRKRDLEFSRRDVSRAVLLEEIGAAEKAVALTFAKLTDADLEMAFPENFDGTVFTTGDFLIHLLCHLNYHVGQIDYHRKHVMGGGSVPVVNMRRLASARKEGGAPGAATNPPSLNFDFDHGVAVLERTPKVLRSLLHGLPDAWLTADEGPDTWSPFNVVGHLIDGEESDWIARTRIILEEGPKRTFDPFNRFGHLTATKGKSIGELLDRFETLRGKNLETLRSLRITRDRLNDQGTHPDFGLVTLHQLLATWVVHDLGHIAQITRSMAGRYRDDVGPWMKYLPVLSVKRRA